jgi:thiaminase/transcriptional activator TenA
VSTGAAAGRYSDELRSFASGIWEAQHAHPFVQGIGDGTLDAERFRHFVRQDYVYLIEYSRLLSLACARAPQARVDAPVRRARRFDPGDEMDMHREFAAGVGDLRRGARVRARHRDDARLHRLPTADCGARRFRGACVCAAALRVGLCRGRPGPRSPGRGQPLRAWIETYASPEFAAQAGWCRALTDELAAGLDDSGRARMLEAFLQSSRHELAFWDMAWQLEGQA